jgi:mono/diheme cytochrome c family protein
MLPLCALLALALRPSQSATEPEKAKAAARGLDYLLHRSYGQPILTQAEYDKLWTVWEPEWKARAEKDPAQRRQLTLERYGFTPSLDPTSEAPLQLVGTKAGLVINCLMCHGGRVPGTGRVVAGMPNTEVDLATFVEDVGKLHGTSAPSALFAKTRGRTNAVFMSHVLLMFRNPDMSMRTSSLSLGVPKIFDMDAPAWWNIKKKRYLYCDALLEGGFARTMMQFAMGAGNGKAMCDWEPDFDDILAYIDSMEPPKYPYPIDSALANRGKAVFTQHCAGCHGAYGPQGKYPNVVVPIEQIGTDPVRLHGLSPEMERYYATTWFAQKSKARNGEPGYAAPPLDGIWATAPYFHNGSVPTLYGVLTESARPKYFRRIGGAETYDRKDVGLKVETLQGPATADMTPLERRRVVDTTVNGMSNQGNPFGFSLTEEEKRQVIEYLKTL